MKSDRTEADVLYELLLKLGFALACRSSMRPSRASSCITSVLGVPIAPARFTTRWVANHRFKPDEDRDAFLNSMGMMYPIHWGQPRMDKDFVETVKIAKTITRRFNQHGGESL